MRVTVPTQSSRVYIPREDIRFTVPLVPPSVNSYARHARGNHYLTQEAKAFKEAVGWMARGQSLCSGLGATALRKLKYELEVSVYFAKGQRGDGDNLWKCIGDGLKEHGVIHSDAAVTDWIMRVRRDPSNPRTDITVRAI